MELKDAPERGGEKGHFAENGGFKDTLWVVL